MRLFSTAAILLSSVLLAGCNLRYHTFPDAPLRFASVNYTVLGPTSAEACGTYIFGIDWGHLFVDQEGGASGGSADPISAIIGIITGGSLTPEASRALYDALDKMPEATNLYAPKVQTTVTGIAPFGMPLFSQRCSSIEARGVKLGTGPVPNAE
jgi:hypothetical protein